MSDTAPDRWEVVMAKTPDSGITWAAVIGADGEERERLLAELVGRMTLKEKVRQMAGNSGPLKLLVALIRYNLLTFNSGRNRRLGIPEIRFTDGPRGVALHNSTCFPVAVARGATWDRELEEKVGSVMGTEARAQGANFFGGVCINLPRHPGWGRSQETFGDDPYLLGEMGAATIRGLQRHVMACAKHYACNSIEESRFYVDVRVDERTLREIYLPHFKRCVDEGVAAVMSAYNRVNGEYCAHNRHLLRDILKGDWGFRGLVMSDFFLGTRDTVKAANGGLDIEMPNSWYFGRKLRRAVRKGKVPEDAVDEAVTRILRQKARFAEVGDPAGYPAYKVAYREHTDLAFEAACKCIVVLKNEEGMLPLVREKVKSIAVIGRLADRVNLGDHGSSEVRPPYAVTPLEGIRNHAGSATEVTYASGEDLELAITRAREADATVIVVGFTGKQEGEAMPYIKVGGDREDLSLLPADVDLIEAVSRETDRCVVVLQGGSAILTSGWREGVRAVLMSWYPGMEGGNALGVTLFGDENPSGKLPITFPDSNDQLPYFDKKAKSIAYEYYHGYRLFDKEGLEPAFPFGFGLHYSTYGYSNLRLSAREIGPDGSLKVEADITNQGEMGGCEVVQVYIACNGSAVDRPVKELKGFTRVHTEPGETKTVSFEIKAADLAYYDTGSGEWVVEEIVYTVYVGSSSRAEDLHLSDTFTISGH
jgi:beta-glucosidase